MARKANPLKKFRRNLYKGARLLGDYTALIDGNIMKRIIRRMIGKLSSRGLHGVFKKWW